MAKQKAKPKLLNSLIWITGVISFLSLGFGMINKQITLPIWLTGSDIVQNFLAVSLGWIVIALTLISAILAVLEK